MVTLRSFFKPEFLNRLDEIITFNGLNKEDIRRIVDIQISYLQARLSERHIMLSLDDLAKNWLAENGYSPEFGARPLKRLIVQEIENPLAMMLLDGEISDNSVAWITADENGIGAWEFTDIRGEEVANMDIDIRGSEATCILLYDGFALGTNLKSLYL